MKAKRLCLSPERLALRWWPRSTAGTSVPTAPHSRPEAGPAPRPQAGEAHLKRSRPIGGLVCLLLCLQGGLATARADLNLGLVGSWSMDEGAGTALADSSSNGNTGTLEGPAWSPGVIGSALRFEGGTYVHIPNSESLKVGPAGLTLSAWVRKTSHADDSTIVRKANLSGGEGGYMLETGAQGELALIARSHGSTMYFVSAAGAVPTGTWCHVVGTTDGTVARLFVNGALVLARPQPAPITPDDWPVAIGRATFDAVGRNAFDGWIDEVRIYNRALAIPEIQELYQASLKEGLVAWWRMNEGTGDTVADSSGHANPGTRQGAAWAPGPIGSALRFEAGTYVHVPNSESLKVGPSGLTLSAWVRKDSHADDSTIVRKANFSGGDGGYMLETGAHGELALIARSHGETFYAVSAPGVVPTGSWCHVVGTCDGSTVRLYVNGASVLSMPQPQPITTDDWPVAIGRASHDTQGANAFAGWIDEVRIYNRALQPFEVEALTAKLSVFTLRMYAGLTLEGAIGTTYRIEYRDALADGETWRPLATVTLSITPMPWFDLDSPSHPNRFYRAVPGP